MSTILYLSSLLHSSAQKLLVAFSFTELKCDEVICQQLIQSISITQTGWKVKLGKKNPNHIPSLSKIAVTV